MLFRSIKIIFQFCDYLYQEGHNIYTDLLVKLSSSSEKNKKRILALLNERGKLIESERAIDCVPKSTNMKEISIFLKTISIDRIDKIDQSKLECALISSELKLKKLELLNLKSKKISINTESICSKCFKIIGNESFHIINNELIHDSCK